MPQHDRTAARLASYRTLVEVSRLLLGSATLEELFGCITDELDRLMPFDAVSIYRVDELAQMLVPVHSVDLWATEIMESPLPIGCGLTGWVVEHGTAENVTAAHNDPRSAAVPGTPEGEEESLVVVPLIVRGQTMGALNVYRLGTDGFDDDEFELICRFGDLTALAIDNAHNRERLVEEANTDWLTGLRNHRFFHERLRSELDRALRHRRPLSLVVFDIDDFKLLNDAHGHQEGDLVLRRVAVAAGEELRQSDVACRVGGEEFAILLPETGKRAARAVAARLCTRVRDLPGSLAVTVSCGVATFPRDAGEVAALVAAADDALYAAKRRGKDRVASAGSAASALRTSDADSGSLARLRGLNAVASKLSRLNDVWQIGDAIVTDLRRMIEFHNARVYVLADDGQTLEPVAFRGELTEYDGETFDALRTCMGEGITGTAAASGRTLNIPDANACEFAVDVPGTELIDESILAVPLLYDERTIGVIVLSKLGIGQFTGVSVRVLELLAAQAAVAVENARLFDAHRRASDTAEALLAIASLDASKPTPGDVAAHVAASARMLCASPGTAVVDTRRTRPRIAATDGDDAVRSIALAVARTTSLEPGEVSVVAVDQLPARSAAGSDAITQAAVTAVHGGLLVVGGTHFSRSTVTAVAAVAGQASLALRNAELLARLEPTG